MEKICVIGTGYVGLILGVCLANRGIETVCADEDKEKIELLQKGVPPIYETGLEEELKKAIKTGKIKFTTRTREAIKECKIIYIAVGTPQGKEGAANLFGIEAVAKEIGTAINEYKIVVNKSTVPIGTTDLVRRIIESEQKKRVNKKELKEIIDFGVVSHPEFLAEGNAIKDFEEERIIIGAEKESDAKTIVEIYKKAFSGKKQIILTDTKSAELTKYASNSMLALRISFMNELSSLCEKTGANIDAIAKGMGLDERIGPKFLQAGAGYGGSCFPKDIRALEWMMKENKCESKIIEAIDYVNEKQKASIILRLEKLVPNLRDKKIALLGLAFKANTDDVRESPAIPFVEELLKKGAKVNAFDPKGMNNFKKIFPKINYCSDVYSAIDGANAIVILTDWKEFKEMALNKVKEKLKEPNIVDGRNIFDPKEMKALGFNYLCIGK